MAGYTVVFDSVFDGTLCGRWPTLPVWLSLLPMADKNGHIDITYQAIAARTGWPIELLKEAIAELMQPDEQSRSAAHEGRRLIPIDPARSWGWVVVNHAKYRERARKTQWDLERTESGRDAERKRIERERARSGRDASRTVPDCPDASRLSPLSDSDSDSDSKKRRARKRASRLTWDWTPNEIDAAYARSKGLNPDSLAEEFRNYWCAKPGPNATKLDWSATWRNWCIGEVKNRGSVKPTLPEKTQAQRDEDARLADAARRARERFESGGRP